MRTSALTEICYIRLSSSPAALQNQYKVKVSLGKVGSVSYTNSKHWFTISFLQPLPYLVTPLGPEKCSANEQFFVGAQTLVSLLQTTQIKQGVTFIAANKVYTSANKTTIVWIETELFFSPGVDASHVYVRALALGCFYSHISTRTFRRALTASLDSCAEIKSAPSVA